MGVGMRLCLCMERDIAKSHFSPIFYKFRAAVVIKGKRVILSVLLLPIDLEGKIV